MGDEFMNCIPAALEEILEEKEWRAAAQQRLLGRYRLPVLAMTLNLPGPYKQFPLAWQSFARCLEEVREQLPAHPLVVEQTQGVAGSAAFLVVDMPPLALKERMTQLEEAHPMGRLLDLDVLTLEGKLSREDLNRSPRRCFVCDQPAALCARSQRHPLAEVVAHSVAMMRSYLGEATSREVAALGVRALIREVSATPKPGLVDRNNSGAHRDMDLALFLDSAESLRPYLEDCVRLGFAHHGLPEALFPLLRQRGQEAEREQLAVTRGVNTHKGAIFSFGLLCGAYGALRGRMEPMSVEGVLDYSAAMAAVALGDLKDLDAGRPAASHGERLYLRHGVTGIRGEAAAGYPSVRLFGLPALERMLAAGASVNDAGVAVLLTLMARVDDTNILHRSDQATLEELQQKARTLLAGQPTPEDLRRGALELDRWCIQRNISPGGCADLLAITYFLYDLTAQWVD